jgi:crotonobetaine/carnitine-CoA ligase
MNNSPTFIFTWLGLAKLGAVMVPINTFIKGESLSYILSQSESQFLFYDWEYEEIVLELDPPISTIQTDHTLENITAFSLDFQSAEVRPESLMSIIYTSGTTGLPKGVQLSHYSYVNTGNQTRDRMLLVTEEDILYTCLPLFHCNAQQITVMGALVSGATIALSPRFSASRFWEEIQFHQATVFNYIGSILTVLNKREPCDREKNNSVTRAFGGAAPKEIWREFEDRFGLTIIEGYGLTEVATVCLCNHPDKTRVGSIGVPLEHVDVTVLRNDGTHAKPNELGEIAVRSKVEHTIFSGYYKKPEATSKALKNGWFYSGDRGYYDEEGFFYFLDRMKDSIRYRGENISSYEVEQIVNKHPLVKESAAIGVPSELGEDDVKVIITVKDVSTFDYEAFIRYCEEKMAYFMIPRYVEIKKKLPKTATERVQKFELRKEGIGESWDRVKAGVVLSKRK